MKSTDTIPVNKPTLSLLAADEPAPVSVQNANGTSPFLLVADHAGVACPRVLGRLGVAAREWQRHIAFDIGIAGLGRILADALDATLIRQNYSRLVIDCNRPLDAASSIPEISEHTAIPGNVGLSDAAKEARARAIFWPYHECIEADLARRRQASRPTALVASRVLWTDGRAHPMNTPRRKPFASQAERLAAAAVGGQPIRSASFVSILVDAGVCRRRGLPRADYFLWNDDFEFTTRLLRGHPGLLCPASVVVHKTAAFGSTDTDPGERFFYEVRNKIWMFTDPAPLAPVERLAYAGSTLRRWARTFAGSRDRRTLGSSLVRGIAAGVRAGPRPNGEVLAEAGPRLPERGEARRAGGHEGDHGGELVPPGELVDVRGEQDHRGRAGQ